MLTSSKRMAQIGDEDTVLVLAIEIAGRMHYFGDETIDITNTFGHPTVLHVVGTNLVESFSKGFDVQTDVSADLSIGITDLVLPVDLATLVPSGEAMVGNRVELALLKRGEDFGQKWTIIAGTVENPTLMSMEAVENTISFSIDREAGLSYNFPPPDYLVGSGWLSSTDTVDLLETPEEAFGLDPATLLLGELSTWASSNFLFSTDSCVLTMPTAYGDSPEYAPFVFGKPGINTDNELWKDLNADGEIDEEDTFGVLGDERLRYFTTPGQTVAVLSLGSTTITDPDVEDGTAVDSIMEDSNLFTGAASTNVVDETALIQGGSTYTFSHNDKALCVRVVIHAGKAAQVGTGILMVDRTNYGTPYDTTDDYTPELGYTARHRPYTFVDIKADYSAYLQILNPQDSEDSDMQVYVVLSGTTSEFHIFGEEVSGASFNEDDATLLWGYAYCCWLGAIRTGSNTADFLQAFFSNPEVQAAFEATNLTRTWQDYHLSCFNSAMDSANQFTIKYPTADRLDAHCPGSWLDGGGQVFLNGAVIENPAELIMFLCELSGLAYDRGSLHTLRDRFRNWRIGGHIDDVTDVLAYVTGVLQSYLPFTVGRSSDGITAKHWKWDATRADAVHHFVEGVDLEVVGEGLVIDESGLVRSLRLQARPVTWVHQETQPFGTTTDLDYEQLTEQERKKLNRLTNKVKNTHGALTYTSRAKRFIRSLRSQYGSWDFSQSSSVTEQADFWRINNYTGDVEAAAIGAWDENELTYPVDDNEREQWSRYMASPLLVAAFRRWEEQDREDLVLELEDVWHLPTLSRIADSLIALRAEPRRTGQGIAKKRHGWIEEGDVVRVTAPSIGLSDQVCLVVEKAWQTTNVAFTFRPTTLPGRDTAA